jgi:hypothetical protein
MKQIYVFFKFALTISVIFPAVFDAFLLSRNQKPLKFNMNDMESVLERRLFIFF